MSNRRPNWNTLYQHKDYLWLPTAQVALLCELANSGPKTALDIGCGTGQLVRDLYHRGYRAMGVDTATEAITIAQASTVRPTNDIRFLVHDICRQPLPKQFDLITCKYTLAFIANRTRLLCHVAQMLATNGTFVIITPQAQLLPANKQHITVPHAPLLAELQTYFADVLHQAEGSDHWYICRQPRPRTQIT